MRNQHDVNKAIVLYFPFLLILVLLRVLLAKMKVITIAVGSDTGNLWKEHEDNVYYYYFSTTH